MIMQLSISCILLGFAFHIHGIPHMNEVENALYEKRNELYWSLWRSVNAGKLCERIITHVHGKFHNALKSKDSKNHEASIYCHNKAQVVTNIPLLTCNIQIRARHELYQNDLKNVTGISYYIKWQEDTRVLRVQVVPQTSDYRIIQILDEVNFASSNY